MSKYFCLCFISIALMACDSDNDQSPTCYYATVSQGTEEQRTSPPYTDGYYYSQASFVLASKRPESEFSNIYDATSYVAARDYIQWGVYPPIYTIKAEGFINFFKYSYKSPKGKRPLHVDIEVGESPWTKKNKLVKISMSTKDALGPSTIVAKDVKVRVVFDLSSVHSYRLIGYGSGLSAAEPFFDNGKGMGDLYSGERLTVLYEVVPLLRQGDLFDLSISYSDPSSKSIHTVKSTAQYRDGAQPGVSDDFKFAAAVAAFALKLGLSRGVGDFSYQDISNLAKSGMGPDIYGERERFAKLVEMMNFIKYGYDEYYNVIHWDDCVVY